MQAYGGAIAGFGVVLAVTTVVHGVPPSGSVTSVAGANLPAIAVAAVLLAAAGAADNVSVIFRQAVLQSAVPDAMRGRLQGIFMVVVTGGPRLGDVWSGALATVVALWFPPLLGGLLIIGALAALLRAQPGFRAYDAARPTP